MPPLCTVGYGLAIGNFNYAGGAIYLFSINAVFIALSTFIVSKLLRFPLVRYANSKRRKRTAQIASLIAIIVMVPSVYLFVLLYDQQVFETETKEFVKEVIRYDGAEVVKFTQDYKTKNIDIYLIGQPVPQSKINEWLGEMRTVERLEGANLRIYQGADQTGELAARLSSEVKAGILEDLYVKNEQLLEDKNSRIAFLENEIARLRIKEVPFQELSTEVKTVYSDLEEFAYSKRISTNFQKTDTLPVFYVRWNKSVSNREKSNKNQTLYNWLKLKMRADTLRILDFPQ
jgi:hypothetical protein